MFIKWITCQVDENSKSPFSHAQEGWSELSGLKGFLGQIGGWDKRNPNEAGIIAFWENQSAYQNFMDHIHDEIFTKSNQGKAYTSISINFYDKMFKISNSDIAKFLEEAKVLRIADCLVHKNMMVEFERVQKEVWNEGMINSQGMLAGVFCRSKEQSNSYLVASLWESELSHQSYVENKLPALLIESGVKDQVRSIKGNLIVLEPKWSVL